MAWSTAGRAFLSSLLGWPGAQAFENRATVSGVYPLEFSPPAEVSPLNPIVVPQQYPYLQMQAQGAAAVFGQQVVSVILRQFR